MVEPFCRICGSQRLVGHHDQGYRQLIRCLDCRVVVADPLPSQAEKADTERGAYEGGCLPEASEFFENCHRDFTEDAVIRGFRQALDWIGGFVRPGDLLDVGSGTGVFLHLARDRGWQPSGLDLCEISAHKAAEEFDLQVDVGDFTDAAYEPCSFDCITMMDVVEHALDPAEFLQRAFSLLRPGGVLYVAVPNQRSLLTAIIDRYIWLGGIGGRWFLDRLYVEPHVYYFNPRALVLALGKAGFEVAGLRGGNVYLGRYRLSPWMRMPLEVVLQAGSLVGMSARILVLAQKPVA